MRTIVSKNVTTRTTNFLKLSIHSYSKCLSPCYLPSMALDSKDTGKDKMLPFCCSQSAESKLTRPPVAGALINGKLIGGAHRTSGRKGALQGGVTPQRRLGARNNLNC